MIQLGNRSGHQLQRRVCPVEEKAKIDICESDQWVADFDSANFGLGAATTARDYLKSNVRLVIWCKQAPARSNFRASSIRAKAMSRSCV